MNRTDNSSKVQMEFLKSARVCLVNAERLLNEAEWLENETPPATKAFLSMTAQEECSKGFLLYLVSTEAIPWSPLLLRAARDHTCKQLIGVVIDFLEPEDDEFFRRLKEHDFSTLPKRVLDAITILRYEKIGRWHSKNWVWGEDRRYDRAALSVAEGTLDRIKQQTLYVEIARDGTVARSPTTVTEQQAEIQYEKGNRFQDFLRGLLEAEDSHTPFRYEEVATVFKDLFSRHL